MTATVRARFGLFDTQPMASIWKPIALMTLLLWIRMVLLFLFIGQDVQAQPQQLDLIMALILN